MSIPTLGTISLDSDRTLLVPVDDLGGNAGARVDYALFDNGTGIAPGNESLVWISTTQIDSPQTVVTAPLYWYTLVWVRVSGRTADGEQSTAFSAATSLDLGPAPSTPDPTFSSSVDGPELVTISTPTISGGIYTLTAQDTDTWVRIDDPSSVSVVVPEDGETDNEIEVGAEIRVEQAGAGAVMIIPETSLPVINSLGGVFTTEGQFAVITLVKVAANEWTIYGRLIS